MENKFSRKKITQDHVKKVEGFVDNIQAEHKKLQEYLESVGIKPVGGWRDVTDFKLVAGLNFESADGECDECSIVTFPDDCITEDCDECSIVTFPDDCVTEGDELNKLGERLNIKTIPRESIQKVTRGGLVFKLKK